MPRPSFGSSTRVVGRHPPNNGDVLEAAKALSEAAGPHSKIVVIGTWPEPQLFDLSSSESGGSCASLSPVGPDSLDSISIKTPTRPRQKAQMLIDSPGVTDWVAYGAPIHDLEDYSDLGSDDGDHTVDFIEISEPAVLLGETLSRRGPIRPQVLLKELQIPFRQPKPMLHRPYMAPPPKRHLFKPDVPPMRLRPIPLPPPPINQAPPCLPPRVPSPASSRTLVSPSDSDSDTVRPEDRIKAEAELLVDNVFACTACDGSNGRMIQLLPCGDLVCSPCFSSSIAAVSVTQGASKCPACLETVTSFDTYKHDTNSTYVPIRKPGRIALKEKAVDVTEAQGTVVMRIDNVAWDVEPYLVADFLPPGSIPLDHPQPIHICIDRRDGRTKDYMYVEVVNTAAARRILQTRQNAFMPGGRITGGRKRAVTISQVTHEELLREVRPGSRAELISLLELCEATLSTPPPQLRVDSTGRGRLHASVGANGKVHYIKYRHAPFHALISIMTKLCGRDSPAYIDVFHTASGAIATLASSVTTGYDAHGDSQLLAKLVTIFNLRFGASMRDWHFPPLP